MLNSSLKLITNHLRSPLNKQSQLVNTYPNCSGLHRNIQKDAPNQNLQSICAQMQNERANFEELRKLSEALGIQQQKQFEQVVAKWTQVEER